MQILNLVAFNFHLLRPPHFGARRRLIINVVMKMGKQKEKHVNNSLVIMYVILKCSEHFQYMYSALIHTYIYIITYT